MTKKKEFYFFGCFAKKTYFFAKRANHEIQNKKSWNSPELVFAIILIDKDRALCRQYHQ